MEKPQEFQLTLNAKERDALLYGWGVVVATLVGADVEADSFLDRISKDDFTSAMHSLTDKLGVLQNSAISDKTEQIRSRLVELGMKDLVEVFDRSGIFKPSV